MSTTLTQIQKDHRIGVGASQVHHVLSLPPYGCARRLWYEKRETKPDFRPVATPEMERGLELEGLIKAKYAQQAERTIYTPKVVLHKEHGAVLCHPDGIALMRGALDYEGLLECKSAGERIWRQIQEEGLPFYWLCQIQYSLDVCDLPWCDLAIQVLEPWEFHVIRIERDAELGRRMVEEVVKFWAQVENGPAPERLEPADKRCADCPWRTTCQGQLLLDMLPEPDEYAAVPFDSSLDEITDRYFERQQLAKQAEELFDEAKAELKAAMGDRQLARCDGVKKIINRAVERSMLDAKALEADHPEIYREYLTKTVYQLCRPYWEKWR